MSTHSHIATKTRSTAGARRSTVIDQSLAVFARTGYHATPVTDVAAAAGISQAYVLRLFDTKLALFVAAVDHCYERIIAALSVGADRAVGGSPEEILDAMGGAYSELIADRHLLLLQVHAQSATDVPEIRESVRRGIRSVVDFVRARSQATGEQVQRFVAVGQLCHLIVTLDIDADDGDWAKTLTAGIRHPPQEEI